jgi:hypothetical protein
MTIKAAAAEDTISGSVVMAGNKYKVAFKLGSAIPAAVLSTVTNFIKDLIRSMQPWLVYDVSAVTAHQQQCSGPCMQRLHLGMYTVHCQRLCWWLQPCGAAVAHTACNRG